MEYSSLHRSLTAMGTNVPYGITHCYLPHGLYPSHLKLVLDSVTPEGCKAEFTYIHLHLFNHCHFKLDSDVTSTQWV